MIQTADVAKDLFDQCQCILEDRKADYGDATQMFSDLTSLWNFYNKFQGNSTTYKAEDIAMFMVLFKLIREAQNHKLDNILDAINYLVLYQQMKEIGSDANSKLGKDAKEKINKAFNKKA